MALGGRWGLPWLVGAATCRSSGRVGHGALGSVTGSDHLRKEGQAQQYKGHHEDKAAETRATAEKHEREAELFEHEEQKHQGT
jgi:uncharacterized protein YjbJ (UPF0337 family)